MCTRCGSAQGEFVGVKMNEAALLNFPLIHIMHDRRLKRTKKKKIYEWDWNEKAR